MKNFTLTIMAAAALLGLGTSWNFYRENQRLYEESVPLACQAFCLNHSPDPPESNSLLQEEGDVQVCYCRMPDKIYRPFELKPVK